jgi:hypothetical protein
MDSLQRFQAEATPLVRDRVEFSGDKTYQLLGPKQQRYKKRNSSSGSRDPGTSGSGGGASGNSAKQLQQITEIIID